VPWMCVLKERAAIDGGPVGKLLLP